MKIKELIRKRINPTVKEMEAEAKRLEAVAKLEEAKAKVRKAKNKHKPTPQTTPVKKEVVKEDTSMFTGWFQ